MDSWRRQYQRCKASRHQGRENDHEDSGDADFLRGCTAIARSPHRRSSTRVLARRTSDPVPAVAGAPWDFVLAALQEASGLPQMVGLEVDPADVPTEAPPPVKPADTVVPATVPVVVPAAN